VPTNQARSKKLNLELTIWLKVTSARNLLSSKRKRSKTL